MPEPRTGGETYRAGPPTPGARLFTAAFFARPGKPAADIGCDHGKLAVYLAAQSACPGVVAVDSRPLPLARARALARQAGLSAKVSCRLGWGLAPLAPREAEDVFIAGLSGETMVDILKKTPWLCAAGIRLVLVPVRRVPLLRRWLCQNGFCIQTEAPVMENGRPYTVLCADYDGVSRQPAPLFCEVGLLPRDDSAAKLLAAARLKDLQKQRNAPLDEAARAALDTLITEVEQWLA